MLLQDIDDPVRKSLRRAMHPTLMNRYGTGVQFRIEFHS